VCRECVLNSVGKYTLNEWAEKDGRPLFVVRFSSSEPKDTEGGTETQKIQLEVRDRRLPLY